MVSASKDTGRRDYADYTHGNIKQSDFCLLQL